MPSTAVVGQLAHGTWEDEWDNQVVAQLSASQEDGDLLVEHYLAGQEWGEWGELPGQLKPEAELQQSVIVLDTTSSSHGGPAPCSPDTKSLEWVPGIGKPTKTDSPVSSRKVITGEQPRASTSAAVQIPAESDELDELQVYLSNWAEQMRDLEDFMTSNEIELVSIVKSRTEEWSRQPVETGACDSKLHFLQRMLSVVQLRKQEWERRPAAVAELSDIVAAVLSLCGGTSDLGDRASREEANVSYLSVEANVVAAWLRNEVSRQVEQPKNSDPFILSDEILAMRRRLQDACIKAFGRDKFQAESKRLLGASKFTSDNQLIIVESPSSEQVGVDQPGVSPGEGAEGGQLESDQIALRDWTAPTESMCCAIQ